MNSQQLANYLMDRHVQVKSIKFEICYIISCTNVASISIQ